MQPILEVPTQDQFKQAVAAHNIAFWGIRACGICQEYFGYAFANGRVAFDSSCGCASSNPEPRSWADVTEAYKTYPNAVGFWAGKLAPSPLRVGEAAAEVEELKRRLALTAIPMADIIQANSEIVADRGLMRRQLNAAAVVQWVPVAERTSRDTYEWLHVRMPDGSVESAMFIDDDEPGDWCQWDENSYEPMKVQPTHFMPKPNGMLAAPATGATVGGGREDLLPEDEEERKQFDRMAAISGGPLQHIAGCLEVWSKLYPCRGSLSKSQVIMHNEIQKAIAAARQYSPVGGAADFQGRVSKWMQETFEPEVLVDFKERGHRFGEEAIELLQANGTTKDDLLKLVDYIYSRPVGEFQQEVGGTMVTLAALCGARGVDLSAAADAEQTRVEQPEVRARIQAKQADKRARMGHSPLPGQPAPASPTPTAEGPSHE